MSGAERIVSKLVAWGSGRDDMRALAVVGSHARSDHPADRWSDLDLVALARRPGRYLEQTRWLAEIETPWLALREPTVVGGEQILHVTFEGGTKLDLVVVSSSAFSLAVRTVQTLGRHRSLARLLPRLARERLGTLTDLLGRGFRLVLDKDGLAERLGSLRLEPPGASPPTREQLHELVQRFLNEQMSFALKLRRGELFVAKTLGEARLMELLLQMIEWHTQVTSDRWSPVFERGRFLEEWAPPHVLERLPATFPGYDGAEVWQARLAAQELFRELAEETGARLGYSYPAQLEDTVMGWVREQAAHAEGGRPIRH